MGILRCVSSQFSFPSRWAPSYNSGMKLPGIGMSRLTIQDSTSWPFLLPTSRRQYETNSIPLVQFASPVRIPALNDKVRSLGDSHQHSPEQLTCKFHIAFAVYIPYATHAPVLLSRDNPVKFTTPLVHIVRANSLPISHASRPASSWS